MDNSKVMMQLDLREIPALYINLAQHTDKNNNMQKMLKECGFKNIQRIEGCFAEGNRAAACAQSHYKNFCHIAPPPPFIVFEDDCVVNAFRPIIEVPQQADAVYLGITQSGISCSHNTPFVEYEPVDGDLYRIYNMSSSHSILYLSEEYVNMCKRITYHSGYVIKNHLDIGFAEVQRWFNVYAFDKPLFHQQDNTLTQIDLTDHLPGVELFYNKTTFKSKAISPRSALLFQRRENDDRNRHLIKLVRRHRLLSIIVKPLVRFVGSFK